MSLSKESIYYNIRPGPRYIFYNSLLNDNPSLAGQAIDYLNKYTKEIQPSTSTQESENRIMGVMKLLKVALQQEQQAELQFLRTNFLDNPLFKIFPAFHSKIERLCSNIERFDYVAVTTAINLAFQGINNFRSNITLEQERQRILKKNIEKSLQDLEKKEKEEKREEQKAYYISRHGSYSNGKYRELLQGLPKTLAQRRTSRIEEIASKVFSDKKEEIIALIEKEGINKISENTILNYILPYITEMVINDLEIDINSIIENISRDLEEVQYNNFSVNGDTIHSLDSLSVRSEKRTSIGRMSGMGLTQFMQDLQEDENEKVIELIDAAMVSGKAKKSVRERLDLLEEIKVNKQLPEAMLTEQQKKDIKNEKYIRAGLSHSLAAALSKSEIYEKVSQIVKGIKISINRPQNAEYISAIQGAIKFSDSNVSVEGSLNLKNDFVIYINTPPFADKTINSILTKELRQAIRQAEISFRKDMKKNDGTKAPFSTTNIEATRTLKRVIDERITSLIKTENKVEQIEAELKRLKESIYIQGSVKDLQSFDNDFGAVGGTLGANPENALDNLQKMYELGGISKLDRDWLYTAVVNTSPSALGHSLKAPIEKYLSFAAAMMMFNYGGSQIEYAAEAIKGIKVSSPSILNLYVINSNYYPASIVLEIILQRLTETANELLAIPKKYYSQTGVQIRSTSTYDKSAVRGNSIMAWRNEFEKASKLVTIDFTFLAGIMDMLAAIEVPHL